MTSRFQYAFDFDSHLLEMIAYCLKVILNRLGKFVHIEVGSWKWMIDYLFYEDVKTFFFLDHNDILDQKLTSNEFCKIFTHNPW